MSIKETFDKYYARLEREAFIKAVFCGLIVGFSANFIAAFLLWYFGVTGLLWSILTLIVFTAAATPIFYFKKFKPDDVQVARRLDRLGLEERMVTMNEFSGDTSYMATIQREDAKLTLNRVGVNAIKFVFSKGLIAALCVLAVCGTGMTTVAGLRDSGIISSGKDVIDSIIPEEPPVYVTVSYVPEEGGMIEGDEVQIFELGGNASPVVAVAEDGWAFKEWSDGVTDPYREDYRVAEDVEYTAIFAQIGDGDDGEGEGEGDGVEGQGQPGSGDQPGKSEEPGDENGLPNNGANGQYTENNMVLDGNTYYRDVFEDYYLKAMEYLESEQELPAELRALIETYFNVLL